MAAVGGLSILSSVFDLCRNSSEILRGKTADRIREREDRERKKPLLFSRVRVFFIYLIYNCVYADDDVYNIKAIFGFRSVMCFFCETGYFTADLMRRL